MQVAISTKTNTVFYKDVMEGLRSIPKYLDSKYFYDASGDKLFQQIMRCDEYYLTNCEMEIMQKKATVIAETVFNFQKEFDVVELGAGDCSKSIYLLGEVLKRNREFIYYPIDISSNVINSLEAGLPNKLRGLQV